MTVKRNNFLVQILLPLANNSGKPFPAKFYETIKAELTERFEGLTAYSRAPAEGLWKPRKGTKREDIIVFEVMAPKLEKAWWKRYRSRLEQVFAQHSIVIRVQKTEIL